ncbi:MAG: hypothetical protein B6244_05300 [Candidatus Cloacimonetes bacterium 4572_55]|nr:MAG: hypothetical protein B6244_05300 [Candidatus Cloacimonetes bacterium 4572_55]
MENKEISILDYIYIAVKWRKLIIVNFFLFCLIMAGYSLICSKTYTSVAILMPPSSGNSLISSVLSSLPFGGFGLGKGGDETDSFLAILKSRTIMESVVDRFDLTTRYEVENMEKAVRKLQKRVDFRLQEEGTVLIESNVITKFLPEEKDVEEARRLVSDMTNFFISEMDRLNSELKTTQARYHRELIEKRYLQNLEDIGQAEQDLKAFQEKYEAIDLPVQLEEGIKAAAQIKAQLMAAEVQLGTMKSFMESNSPQVRKVETQIKELRAVLRGMKYGGNIDMDTRLFPVFSDAPELGVRYLQLRREMEVQHTLYEFLIQQYEQAKLQEMKDTPTVQILDAAIPPIKRSAPKRALMVASAGFMSLILSFFIILIAEYINMVRASTTGEAEKWSMITREVFGKKK